MNWSRALRRPVCILDNGKGLFAALDATPTAKNGVAIKFAV
jgi:hypothetical protein